MWRCLWCGKEFEELAHWKEDRGECFGYPAYEDMCGCPYCYSGDVEEFDEWEDEDEEEDESEYGEDEYYASLGVFDQESEDEKQ